MILVIQFQEILGALVGNRQFKTGSRRDSAKNKPPLSKLPFPALVEVAFVHEYGDSNFGTGNWRKGQPFSELSNSMLRHWEKWFYHGEDLDPKSGRHHLAHMAWNALILLWEVLYYNPLLDDRQTSTGEWRSKEFAKSKLAKELEK